MSPLKVQFIHLKTGRSKRGVGDCLYIWWGSTTRTSNDNLLSVSQFKQTVLRYFDSEKGSLTTDKCPLSPVTSDGKSFFRTQRINVILFRFPPTVV